MRPPVHDSAERDAAAARYASRSPTTCFQRSAVGAEDVLADHVARPGRIAASRAAIGDSRVTTARARECSSICPSVARIVAAIGGDASAHSPIQRLQHLVDLRLDPSGDVQHPPDERRTRRHVRADGPSTKRQSASASAHAAVPAAGPRLESPSSIHRPGALPRAFSMTRAPPGTIACRRLLSGIGSLIATGAEPLAEPCRDVSVLRQRPAERRRHRLPRHVVVGRAEAAAVHTTRSARASAARKHVRELLAIVAGHALHRRRRCPAR